MQYQHDDVKQSYDQVAAEYARQLFAELEHKPLDRELLTRFAGEIAAAGLVCDVGCGPGHVARYLHEQGVRVQGIDLSPGMVAEARRRNPELEFLQGDMLALPLAANSLAGIVAFYSLIHIPRTQVVQALREFWRVLQPGGLLLLSFHIGTEDRYIDDLWGHKVSAIFRFFEPEEMESYLQEANFTLIERIERNPYPEVEVPTQRAYIFARKERTTD